MPELNITPEKAEAELLELVRGEDAVGFKLTVTCDDGRWYVVSEDLDAGTTAIGHGDSFAEAWFNQAPGWAGVGQGSE